MVSSLFSHFSFMDLPANKFSGLIPATFSGLVSSSSCPLLDFIGRLSPVTGAASAAAILIVTVALPGFFYLKKNKNKPQFNVRRESRETPIFDPRLNEFVGGLVHQDAEYAEELQLQEALVASLYTGQSSNYASLSGQGLLSEPETLKLENERDDQLNSFCEICLDNKESWEMFKNDGCSHSFCYECTSKHIMARISQKSKVIGCPGVSCCAALDVNACRFMIPEEALILWDESVCQSMILDSQKLYCPFRDCSALLVNDSEVSIERIECPLCKRSFCAACRVPWHSEFTCKEFQKLNAKKSGKGEDMVKTLAKKKNWQKCPNCKIFVEKTEGCIHMTCRCEYEFCYRCGAKWTGSHNCRRK
ncbi:E3 ubiquitin-protein ligase RSL1-like isoform X2 [Lycium ferocissimum]|uniref:E3 ubiquitin-protein ligase RSL1-like isoform X2 n=1 Tax=Lycium ferocissimum TaxID=112874 RepID=UPI00281687F0|nr:E3 ubiquitin-protein ligase RSL1-like isoform X2 [Lycium ferocissimum]